MGINALFENRQAGLKTASVEVKMKKEKKHIISVSYTHLDVYKRQDSGAAVCS